MSSHAPINGPDPSTEELVLRARQEGGPAFAGLVERFRTELFLFVFFRTGSREDAEDLTQDIWMNAFRKLSGLKDPSLFKPWLFRSARNRVTDYHRRKRIRRIFGFGEMDDESRPTLEHRLADERPNGLDTLIQKDFWANLRNLVRGFSAREREVFMMRYLDQLSIREIAQVVDSSESSVKTHLHRAIKKAKGSSWLRTLKEERQP